MNKNIEGFAKAGDMFHPGDHLLLCDVSPDEKESPLVSPPQNWEGGTRLEWGEVWSQLLEILDIGPKIATPTPPPFPRALVLSSWKKSDKPFDPEYQLSYFSVV